MRIMVRLIVTTLLVFSNSVAFPSGGPTPACGDHPCSPAPEAETAILFSGGGIPWCPNGPCPAVP